MSSEAKVGLLIVGFFIIVGIFTFKIGGDRMPWDRDGGYRVHIFFDSISGLKTKSKVRYAGVEIGYVESIALEDGRAKVTIKLDPNIVIPANAKFVIGSSGLMGDKFIAISGGSAKSEPLKGEANVVGNAPVDMDQLLSSLNRISIDVGEITTALKTAIGTGDERNRLTVILENVQILSESLAKTATHNDQAFSETIENIRMISRDIRSLIHENSDNLDGTMQDMHLVARSLADTLPDITRDLERALSNLNDILETNKPEVDTTAKNVASASENLDRSMSGISKIVDKVDSGQGSIGKLINEDRFHENLNDALIEVKNTAGEVRSFIGRASDYRIYVGYRGEYLQDREDWKSYISMKIQPRPDKYYLFEIISQPEGSRKEEEFQYDFEQTPEFMGDSDTYRYTRTTWTTSDPVYSFQFAKIYHRLTVRGGLIENTGGFGLDMNLYDDMFWLSVDGWDFNRSTDPHFKLTGRLDVGDTFYLTGGWDDFMLRNDEQDSIFFGAGLKFEDKDLKYLLSFIPLMGN
ncbi:MCE family protein [bacterium]|nr:MCE family protein [candidate division CSSED10-310 bacterium]